MLPRYGFVRPANGEQAIGPARSSPGLSHRIDFGHLLGSVSLPKLASTPEPARARCCLT